MAKLSTIKNPISMLVQGVPGTGKTYLIGTLCNVMPTVIITGEGRGKEGLETLKGMKLKYEPEIEVIGDWSNVWSVFERVEGYAKTGTIKGLAVDDLGSVQDIALRKLQFSPLRDETRMKTQERLQKVRKELMLGERRLFIDQWGELSIALNNFVSELLALPFAVRLFSVLEATDKHPRTGLPHLFPDLYGSIAKDLAASFGIVANAFVEEYKGKSYYVLSTKPNNRLETKIRSIPSRTWVDPTVDKLLLYIADPDGNPESSVESEIGVGTVEEVKESKGGRS